MGLQPRHIVHDGPRFAPTEVAQFYRVSKTLIRSPDYFGAVADEPIRAGAVIGREGGRVLSSVDDLPTDKAYCTIIAPGLYLAPADYDRMEPLWFINHRCDANVARIGGTTLVAKRDIRAGEELTIEYAPLVAGHPGWRMECLCGAAGCRRLITGDDWQDPVLARRFWTEWLPHVQRLILERGIL